VRYSRAAVAYVGCSPMTKISINAESTKPADLVLQAMFEGS
jgi:hypothetical protein